VGSYNGDNRGVSISGHRTKDSVAAKSIESRLAGWHQRHVVRHGGGGSAAGQRRCASQRCLAACAAHFSNALRRRSATCRTCCCLPRNAAPAADYAHAHIIACSPQPGCVRSITRDARAIGLLRCALSIMPFAHGCAAGASRSENVARADKSSQWDVANR